tara:strand:- start:6543 stop:7049 length:507 start_codon:yes stop_codon:yes gene_type:complete
MALKADRHELATDISFFMDEVASRGGIACISTGGSGAALDQAGAKVSYVADASGAVPAGLLLNDMVNLDLTRQHINWHKDEVQKGGKVTLLTQGNVVTNMIYPGDTPTAGGLAYVAHSGYIAAANKDDTLGQSSVVGRFISTKDEDGYVKVAINLPNNNIIPTAATQF